ncbi:MAG: ABC transporter ATP-binding protein [Chloroflexi bacterium]|nr:ABC transporter ATP-binding protein [Chloroflexota bacterium]
MLQVEGLSLAYNHIVALEDVSFHLPQGTIAVVLGPNGAGKSTLLRCLNHILRPDRGHVYVEGRDVATLSPQERARIFGYVPQINTGNSLTVFDTVLLGRRPHMGWRPSARDLAVVEEVLHWLRLDSIALRPTHALSGGELQKVVLARALAQEPKILLLDEFTNNLDIRNRLEAMQWVRRLSRERHLTALVVTHEFNLALRYGDVFILMAEGRVRAMGDRTVLTSALLEEVYGIRVRVVTIDGVPVVVPIGEK